MFNNTKTNIINEFYESFDKSKNIYKNFRLFKTQLLVKKINIIRKTYCY